MRRSLNRLLLSAIFLILIWPISSFGELLTISGLYVRTFGKKTDPAVIFVHGGPGYDSSSFETSAAEPLAQLHYFVVTYDQRGQGRSAAAKSSDFTYQRYAEDLKAIIDKLQLKHASLLAHSFGGSIAARFQDQFPHVVEKIVLIAAPIDIWTAMNDIHAACGPRNAPKLGDHLSAAQVARVLQSTLSCGHPDSTEGRSAVETPAGPADPLSSFLANEDFVHVRFRSTIERFPETFFGIYGTADPVFAPATLKALETLFGKKTAAFQLIKDAPHEIFVKNRAEFLTAVDRVLKSGPPKN